LYSLISNNILKPLEETRGGIFDIYIMETKILSNSEILEITLKETDYIQICDNISKGDNLKMELFQEVMLSIMKKKNKFLNDLHQKKQLKYYIIFILKQEWSGSNSSFNRNFRQKRNQVKIDINVDLSTIDIFTENYNGKLFKKLIELSDDEYSNKIKYYLSNIDRILSEEKYWNNGIQDWYGKELFEMYFKLNDYNMIDGYKRDLECTSQTSSMRKIERRTGIDHVSVSFSIRDTKKYIQDILKEEKIM